MPKRQSDARLMVPPLPPHHVARPRLLVELTEGRSVPLTLVAAGPGAGKTVLLSDWARRHDEKVAWLSVGPVDNEPRRFWRLFLSALRGRPGAASLDVPVAMSVDGTTDMFESLFIEPPARPLTVIIDDAHVLTHPQILSGLDRIVCGWYPQLRLVLAARSDPLLPVHRYRLSGAMRELRAAQLAMTPDEARALLGAHGVALPDAALDALAVRTEGWAAGLRLCAIRMTGAENPTAFVHEFAVDQGSTGEYLIEEVLDRQPEHIRRVLVETGFLNEVTGPLATAVTEIDGCGEILTDLARTNSFVYPVDAARTKFRYHQMLAEILCYLGRRRAPTRESSRMRRAAVWYASQGDLTNALMWTIRAGDVSDAAKMLVYDGLARAYVERMDLVASGIRDLLPLCTDEADDSGILRAARSAILALTADRATAARQLLHLGPASEPTHEDPHLRITALLVDLILAEKAGDTSRADETAARVLVELERPGASHVSGLRAAMLSARARAAFYDGRDEDVDRLVQEALTLAEQDEARSVELDVLGLIAYRNVVSTRNARADEAFARATELQAEFPDLSPAASLELAVAWRAYLEASVTRMGRALQRALASPAIEWDAGLATSLAIARAQHLLPFGQAAEARSLLYRQDAMTGEKCLARLASWRDLLLATIEIQLGRPNGALELVRRYRGTPFDAPADVIRARAHLALGESRSAHDCVRRALSGSGENMFRHLLVDAVLCAGHIALQEADPPRAVEWVVRAIEIADGDIVMPFTRLADVFAPLLARHPTVAACWPTPPEEGELTPPTVATPLELPEALTDRERTVLRFLATSMSTAEIAEELCLSVNTVKTHLAAIYRKLAARKRREAVLRAREFELL